MFRRVNPLNQGWEHILHDVWDGHLNLPVTSFSIKRLIHHHHFYVPCQTGIDIHVSPQILVPDFSKTIQQNLSCLFCHFYHWSFQSSLFCNVTLFIIKPKNTAHLLLKTKYNVQLPFVFFRQLLLVTLADLSGQKKYFCLC